MKSSLGWFAVVALLFAGCENTGPTTSPAANLGRFEGQVVASWDNDGRNMTLREPFAYVDPQSRTWLAPAGATVNGASIPYAFWSFIGGPFEGQYRNASVVHDIGCHEMTAAWQDVHRMFYDACRCGGVEESRAKMLYYAVYHFGPRWETVDDVQVETATTPDGQLVQREVALPTVVRIDPPPPTAEEVEQATAMIAEENPAPAVIEQTNREALRRRPRPGGYGKRPDGMPGSMPGVPSAPGREQSGPNWQHAARSREGNPNWQRPSAGPGGAGDWNGERRPGYGPNQFAGDGTRSRPAPGQWQGVAPREMQRPQFQPEPRPELSPQEIQWAEGMVRQHLERQTGEQRPAEYNVARTERGYRVQVQYVHLDSQGQPAGVSGESTLRLGRDGRVMEMINRY